MVRFMIVIIVNFLMIRHHFLLNGVQFSAIYHVIIVVKKSILKSYGLISVQLNVVQLIIQTGNIVNVKML